MDNIWFKLLYLLIGGIAIVCSAIFGTACLYVFIPLSIACGFYFWYTSKDFDGERNMSNAIYVTIGLVIASFILAFVGSCINGCVRGGGDTQQQRIEMGLTPY